jgi:hypothetical protein
MKINRPINAKRTTAIATITQVCPKNSIDLALSVNGLEPRLVSESAVPPARCSLPMF